MKKRILSALLALILCFGTVTVTAHAADEPAVQSVQTETAETLLSQMQSKTPDVDRDRPGICGTAEFSNLQAEWLAQLLFDVLQNPFVRAVLVPVAFFSILKEMVTDIAQGVSVIDAFEEFIYNVKLLFS